MKEKKYKVVDGTSYDARTSDEVIRILEIARHNRTRIMVEYGDTETGQGWGDVHDVTGYIGRSTGQDKIPLLIYNKRSMGGGAMLDYCIVSIVTSIGKAKLYAHPNYITGRK